MVSVMTIGMSETACVARIASLVFLLSELIEVQRLGTDQACNTQQMISLQGI